MDDLSSQLADSTSIPKVPASQSKVPEDNHPSLSVQDQSMASDLDLTADAASTVNAKITGMIPKIEKAETEKAEAAKTEATGEANQWDSYQKELRDIYRNSKPSPVNIQAAPKLPDDNPLQQFGSLASMIGIFASAFTKKPIVNALNASADAMKAQQANNKEAYDLALKQWEDQTKLAFDKHKTELEDLHEIMEFAQTDQAAALAKLKAWGVVNSSSAASVLAELGDWEEIGKWVQSQQVARDKILENKLRVGEFLNKNAEAMRKNQVYEDTLEANFPKSEQDQLAMQVGDIKAKYAQQGKTGSPEEAKEIGAIQQVAQQKKAQAERSANMAAMGKQDTQAAALLDDDDKRFLAERFIAGDKTAISGLGYGNVGAANRVGVQHMIREIAEERHMNPQQVALKLQEFQAMTRALGSVETRGGTISMFAYEADKMADQALAASAKVKRGNFVPITKLEQTVAQNISDPNLKQLKVALNALKNTWAKAINGGNQPHQGDKTTFDEMIYQADGPKALEAGIAQIKQELKAAQESPQVAIKNMRRIETEGEGDSDSGEENSQEDVPPPPEGFEIQ